MINWKWLNITNNKRLSHWPFSIIVKKLLSYTAWILFVVACTQHVACDSSWSWGSITALTSFIGPDLTIKQTQMLVLDQKTWEKPMHRKLGDFQYCFNWNNKVWGQVFVICFLSLMSITSKSIQKLIPPRYWDCWLVFRFIDLSRSDFVLCFQFELALPLNWNH